MEIEVEEFRRRVEAWRRERGGCGLQVIARSECVFDEAVAVAVDCSDQVSPPLVAERHEMDASRQPAGTK